MHIYIIHLYVHIKSVSHHLDRKKWRQIKKRETFKPKFAAVVPVRNLYGQRLRSKQALKSLYGKMTERQFKKFYDNSEFGNTRSNINLKGLLERRLDNFITRIGFTSTVLKGRQSILHGCFKVNGKIIKSGGPELALELEKKGYENFN